MLRDAKLLEKFWKQYDVVFSSDGEINACGREACKEMIEICEQIDDECLNGKYGNSETGWLNPKQIKELAFDLTEMN